MKLIGLIGHAGSGKNTFAEEFHYHSYKELAFADPLKAACASLFEIPIASFTSRKYKELPDPYWKVSPREIAQFVGTELVRNHMHELLPNVGTDFWCEAMKYRLHHMEQEAKVLGSELKVIITDVRFANEMSLILQLGGHIIHLTRPEFNGTVGIQNHSSEELASIFRSYYPENSHTHYINNEGSLDDLKLKAHAFADVVMK